jgi:cation diffusion facilitator family transporter
MMKTLHSKHYTADERRKKIAAVRLSLASNSVLIILKVIVGLLTASISVLSEAVHSAVDLVAAVIAAVGVAKASRPADEGHPFGHGKFENISGALEALLIFGAAAFIIVESIHKLLEGGVVVNAQAGMAVMAFSAAVNLVVSGRLMKMAHATDSIALEADGLHLRTDVYTSLGVLIALGAISAADRWMGDPQWVARFQLLDPLVALIVAAIIVRAAYDLTRRSLAGLVDRPLPVKEDLVIREILSSYSDGFLEFHHLRHRKSGSERHIDLHLVVSRHAKVGEVHRLCDEIERTIESRLARANVIIHVEPCSENCPVCRSHLGCPTSEERDPPTQSPT